MREFSYAHKLHRSMCYSSRHLINKFNRGVYPPKGHGAFPQKWPDGSPQFLMMMHLKCCADVYVKKVKSALVQSNKCIHVIINCYRHEQKHHAFFFNFVSAGASTHGGEWCEMHHGENWGEWCGIDVARPAYVG